MKTHTILKGNFDGGWGVEGILKLPPFSLQCAELAHFLDMFLPIKKQESLGEGGIFTLTLFHAGSDTIPFAYP